MSSIHNDKHETHEWYNVHDGSVIKNNHLQPEFSNSKDTNPSSEMLLLFDGFFFTRSDFKIAKRSEGDCRTSTAGKTTDGLTTTARRRNGLRRFTGFPGPLLLYAAQNFVCFSVTSAFDIVRNV